MQNIRTYISIGIISSISIFQSCKVGKSYQQPSFELPDQFRNESYFETTDSISLADISWQSFFDDEALIALIEKGLANNYDMQTAIKNIEIANRNLGINKYEYLPSVDLTIGSINQQYRSENFYANPSSNWYDHKGTDAPGKLFNYQSQYATNLGFSWEIDTWGKIAHQQDMLKASLRESEEIKHAIQTKLVANIATGYFNLLMLDAQIEVARRNEKLGEQTLGIMKLQFDAGEITALALQQVKSQTLVASSLIPELEKEIAIQENALHVLLGQMPDSVGRSQELTASLIKFHDHVSLGAPLEIIRNRPDIQQAELKLIQANARMNLRQIMRYPSLSLSGVFGVNSMLPENWFNIPGSLLGSFVGNLSTPIFKNKKLKNQYEIAMIEREKAELALQQNVRQAVAEVSNSVIIVQKQKEQLDLARQRVDNAQLAVHNAALLFRSGYATYLEVITAQSNALRSELDYTATQQKQLNAYVNLYRSLGGGWK